MMLFSSGLILIHVLIYGHVPVAGLRISRKYLTATSTGLVEKTGSVVWLLQMSILMTLGKLNAERSTRKEMQQSEQTLHCNVIIYRNI